MPSGWISKSRAKREYKLTENQIELAIERGLVEAKRVPNPHYRSGPPMVLLKSSDLVEELEEIEQLPRYSEEELELRRIYAARSRKRKKAREELSFYCPRCKSEVAPPKGSTAVESVVEGQCEIDDRLKKAVVVAHYRHVHTSYEAELEKLRKEKYRVYSRLRDEGYGFEEAWFAADCEFESREARLKEKFALEAAKRAKQDGLI